MFIKTTIHISELSPELVERLGPMVLRLFRDKLNANAKKIADIERLLEQLAFEEIAGDTLEAYKVLDETRKDLKRENKEATRILSGYPAEDQPTKQPMTPTEAERLLKTQLGLIMPNPFQQRT